MRIFGKIILWLFASFGALLSIGLIVGLTTVVSLQSEKPTIEANSILWLDLDREISERPQSGGFFQNDQAPTFLDYLNVIEQAEVDENIIAIATDLSYHNLGMAQIQELRTALLRFQNNSGKKAYLYAEDLGSMGSGMINYYLASAFSEIWLNPTGGVGINGLAIEVPYFADALEKLDIKAEMAQRHEFKGGADPFIRSDMTEPVRNSLQNLLDQWQKQMTNDILATRWDVKSNFDKLIENSPYLAQPSLELGLVDRLAYWDEYQAMLQEISFAAEAKTVSVGYYLSANTTDENGFNFESADQEDSNENANIALIHGVGPITGEDYGPGYYTDESFSPYTVAEAIADAREDPSIDAVIFRVSSPGGAYAQSDMVRREVLKFKETGKPIVVTMGNDAASGGYFVSMGADHIIAQPGTVTGSIGVYAGKVATKRLWDKLGVNWERIETGPQAGMWSMISDFTPSQRKKFQESLDFVYDDFSGKAASDRGLNDSEIDNAARGRIWTGHEAIKAKLIDELGGHQEALAATRRLLDLAPNATLDLYDFPSQPTPMEQLETILSSDDPMHFLSTEVTNRVINAQLPKWVIDIKSQLKTHGLLTMPSIYLAP